ncbi:unnamed protein product [Cylindrotheca closterium]|uniref:Carbohydrate kinase PfkB domain-containing protein n=1 Tax=Cylindrotheca closterium TaxID=2856 RepID=A0AAD2CAY4_9STRA|nr:unnamed protein product [Cylindrotheca closterium]
MKAMSATKIIVGLNGALQKRFILPDDGILVPGNVHRAASIQTGVGGKGQDVAIAMNCLAPDSDSGLKLAQFVGCGSSGNSVYDLLKDILGESALDLTVRTKEDTRICTSIVASDETTELVEPSGLISGEEMDELLVKLNGIDAASALCIMGSMPPGCDEETYAKIYDRSASTETLCLVDSVAGVESLLAKMDSKKDSGPSIFKVNASELCKLAGSKKSSSEAGGITFEELTEAIKLFREKYSTSRNALVGLAITDGRHPGYFAAFDKNGDDTVLYKLPVPVLDPGKPLFPIGAGDAVAGGTLAAWLCLTNDDKSTTLLDDCWSVLQEQMKANKGIISDPSMNAAVSAFTFGLACGSASCLQEENSVLDPEDVVDLLKKIGNAELVSA